MTIEKQIEADVSVLMYRALFEKEIHVFGEDGFGKFGHCDRAKTFKISDLSIDVDLNQDTGDAVGIVYLTLDGYDEKDCGMILTDQNAEISIAKLLKDEHIDSACLKWAAFSDQGTDYIAMFIDVPLLLDWA
jgi:hypothetical protein